MSSAPRLAVTRRAVAALLAGAVAGPTLAAGRPRIVTLLGDSITAGYGLPRRESLPVRLEARLAALAPGARVRGAGVSGDTAADGLARVDFSVQADTSICVVALGGNDLLQGLEPAATRASLDRIIRRLKARKIGVVLAGMTAPPSIGGAYARDFSAIFPALARQHGVPLYPDLLAGVSGRPALIQRDGIHPNAAGVEVIAGRLAPVIARTLNGRG